MVPFLFIFGAASLLIGIFTCVESVWAGASMIGSAILIFAIASGLEHLIEIRDLLREIRGRLPKPPEASACPACGVPNEAPAKFCGGCGAALVAGQSEGPLATATSNSGTEKTPKWLYFVWAGFIAVAVVMYIGIWRSWF